jgi:hypothetical protein
MKLTDIKPNERNPRKIDKPKIDKLKKSIQEFEKMLELRPIVVDENSVILGGNMRYFALKELGYKDIPDTWVKRANELTETEKQRFIIADNLSFGEWDWELLATDWNAQELSEWGLELPEHIDYSDKNSEIDTDDFSEKMQMVFEFDSAEFQHVMDSLANIDANKETAILKLLKYA